MLYREFGKTGEKVSILGFGCMRFPTLNGDVKQIDEIKATEMIRYAIDNGVNYIDTAYPYHGGMSEPFVAKVLKDGYREKVYLATKLPSWLIKTREDMDKYLNEQLERLETEYIDFYLLHTLEKSSWDNLMKNEVLEFLEKAKKNGKIKHIGFSFHDKLEVFKEIVDAYDWEFCQIQLNFLDEDYQAGLEGLKYATDKNIGMVIMEPLRGGKLANNIPDDIMNIWDRNSVKRTPVEWALRYIWNHPEVNVVLSGMSEMDHVVENLRIANEAEANSLKPEEKNLIDEVKEMYLSRIKVNCTDCKYCMPCPAGVNIPRCFSLFNDGYMFNQIENYRNSYNKFVKDENKASMCVECGKCEEVCPQHIKIRDMLHEVVEIFEK